MGVGLRLADAISVQGMVGSGSWAGGVRAKCGLRLVGLPSACVPFWGNAADECFRWVFDPCPTSSIFYFKSKCPAVRIHIFWGELSSFARVCKAWEGAHLEPCDGAVALCDRSQTWCKCVVFSHTDEIQLTLRFPYLLAEVCYSRAMLNPASSVLTTRAVLARAGVR